MSRPSAPVGTTFTSGGALSSPRRMMLPLPNCFSIVDTARSIALSRWASRGGGGGGGGGARGRGGRRGHGRQLHLGLRVGLLGRGHALSSLGNRTKNEPS